MKQAFADTDHFVALLGTKGGPAIRTGSTNPTSSLAVLAGKPVVIDCGLGVTRGLVDQGMALNDLSLIFITHLHSDHYLELGPLIHTAWTAGLNTPVHVFGPRGIDAYWRNFVASMKDDIELRIDDEGRPDLAGLVSFTNLAEGTVIAESGFEVSVFRNAHPPLIDTFALRFSTRQHKVVFSGDTTFLPAVSEFSRDADLLVHEAMLNEALDALVKRVGNTDDRLMKHLLRSHTLAQDAGKIAAQAGVKALALNHLVPSDDADFGEEDWRQAVRQHWDGTLFIGNDGMRIDLSSL